MIVRRRGDLQEPSLRDPSHLRWAPPSYAAEGGHRLLEVTPPPTKNVKSC